MSLSNKTGPLVSRQDLATGPQEELFWESERAGLKSALAPCPVWLSGHRALYVLSQDLRALPRRISIFQDSSSSLCSSWPVPSDVAYCLSSPVRSCFPRGLDGKESACSVGDPASIPGLGRLPGEGNCYPLQYSCLENPMDRGAWWAIAHGAAKGWTQLSD